MLDRVIHFLYEKCILGTGAAHNLQCSAKVCVKASSFQHALSGREMVFAGNLQLVEAIDTYYSRADQAKSQAEARSRRVEEIERSYEREKLKLKEAEGSYKEETKGIFEVARDACEVARDAFEESKKVAIVNREHADFLYEMLVQKGLDGIFGLTQRGSIFPRFCEKKPLADLSAALRRRILQSRNEFGVRSRFGVPQITVQ